MVANSPAEVLGFWFEECTAKQWWKKDPEFDRLIRTRFAELHQQAARAELWQWRQGADLQACAEGRLAEILVLDQFSRNIYRDTPAAFAQDPQALVLAQELVAAGLAQLLPTQQRIFAFMPYMHSESREIHQIAVQLFEQPGMEDNLRFELRHKAIIDRFGRYPHRNGILGRLSSDQELAFLQQPGSSF